MARWLDTILARLGLRPRSHSRRSTDDEVNAWLDARESRRSNDEFITAMLRDPSVLDDLASQRPWMDDLAGKRPRAPDQADAVLHRLGLAAQGSRGGQRYARTARRRPVLCAVCIAAFSFGMWARSQDYLVNENTSANGIDRQVADVISNVPADLQPLGRVQNILRRIGNDFSTSLDQSAQRPVAAYASTTALDPTGPTKPHVAQTGAWFLAGFPTAASTFNDRPHSRPSRSADSAPPTVHRAELDWWKEYTPQDNAPAPVIDNIDVKPVDDGDLLDAVSNLGCL